MPTSILFISADPRDESRLRLGEEHREIDEKLRLARLRDEFKLEPRSSARPEDLSQAMLDVNPAIVHFSGHGSSRGAICLEDDSGNALEVPAEALGALFQSFGSQTRCVLLNACYSRSRAEAIAEHIAYVIGMSDEISDAGAIAFSVGFYQAVGAGRSIEEAFDLGCAQLRLRGIPGHSIPQLLRRQDLSSFHGKRTIPTPGGSFTLFRKGRTLTDKPGDPQRIGLAAFSDGSSWEMAALVTSSGSPEQSAEVTSAAMGVLGTYVQDLMGKNEEQLTIPTIFKNCFLCLDMGVKAAIASKGVPSEVGAKGALMFRLGEAVYAANIGGSGILGVWRRDKDVFVRQLNLKSRYLMDASSPSVVETPLGHLVVESSSEIEELGVSAEFELTPELVPLAESGDFLALTSYGLPSSEVGREELAEEVGKRIGALDVGRFLIENDLPEESAVLSYARERSLQEGE